MPVELFIVDRAEIQTALAELHRAESRGFNWCRPVFRLYPPPPEDSDRLMDRVLRYSDLWERAHPIDGRLDWGRYQNVSRDLYFYDGKLQTAPETKPPTRRLVINHAT